jgi:hypothetical protein
MRAAIIASLVAAVALTLPAGLSLTAVRAGALSPADKYVECVERAANESASRHVGDVEVARSPVPAKVLSAARAIYEHGSGEQRSGIDESLARGMPPGSVWRECAPKEPTVAWVLDTGKATMAAETGRDLALKDDAAKAKADAEAKAKAEEEKLKAAYDAYRHCLESKADSFAVASGDPVDTVITGAFGACWNEGAATAEMEDVTRRVYGPGFSKIFKELMVTKLTTAIFDARAKPPALSRYLKCVEGAAALEAHAHVRDPEVARSPVPEKILSIYANKRTFELCGDARKEAEKETDLAATGGGAYDVTTRVIKDTLASDPPQRQPPPPGSDDYVHGEKLDPGAWEHLSIECQALLDWDKYAVPASCAEAVREANRVQKDKEQANVKTLAALPSVQFCLGLKYDTTPEKTESVVNEALRRIQAMNDEEFGHVTDCSLRVRTADSPIVQYCLGLKRAALKNNPKDPFEGLDDDLRVYGEAMSRLREMGADDWAKVGACEKHVEAAGGLVAIDPVGEMERINRIPAVQDASKQYSDCAIGRAVQMARVSEEPAETIARAALGGCALLRQQYLAVVARELRIIMTLERAAEEEKETTEALVGHVIAARAAAAGRSGEDAERK